MGKHIADIANWDDNWSPGKKIVEIFLTDPEFQNIILPDGVKLGSKTNSLPFEEELGAKRPLPEIVEEVEIPKGADPLVELILQQRNDIAKKQKPSTADKDDI